MGAGDSGEARREPPTACSGENTQDSWGLSGCCPSPGWLPRGGPPTRARGPQWQETRGNLPLSTHLCQGTAQENASPGASYRWHALSISDLGGTAAAAKSLQSCPTLCDPIDGSPPGSPVPGILQARTLERVAISFYDAWKWKWKWKWSRSVVSNS